MEPQSDTCSFYYTKQSVDNLRIKVCLQQLTGTQLVDVSPRVVEGTSTGGELALSSFGIPLSTFSSSNSNASNKQQQIVSWQQKILSANEIVEYSRQAYADSPKYKNWHEQALKLKKRKHWKKRLFTYIHEDDYQSRVREPATSSEGIEPEILLRRRNSVYVRRQSSEPSSDASGEATFRAKKKPKDKSIKQSVEQQYFYIMADLAPSESLGETTAYEVVLFALRYNVNGLLTVAPDFNKPNTKPYRLESFGSDNALYEYTLSHASFVCSAEDKKKEEQMIHQICRQRLEEIQQKVGSNWDEDQLKNGEMRLIVNGEITRARYFDEANNLYIHFLLHLPPGWKVSKNSTCEGFTPTCGVRYKDGIGVVHYSTPFTLDMTRTKAACQDWPVLLLGAFSVDWWERDRDEGYGTFVLPLPGQKENSNNTETKDDYIHTVRTWRPAQNSAFSKMRRHFLGGCQLLTDSSYLVVGANASSGKASRLGFSTISSGEIELQVNTMMQTEDVASESSTVKGLHSTTWQLSTHAVLDAFHRSRQKLKAAKQGLFGF